MTVVIPFAHLGHVLIDLPVFLGPVAAVGAWVAIATRRARADDDDDPARAPLRRRDPEPTR